MWVLGDSIPYWAGIRAVTTGKPNLRIPNINIGWWGIRGLKWAGFRRAIETQAILCEPPKIIFVHLGGNDITSNPLVYILNSVQREFRFLRAAFPQTVLVYINILPRLDWRSQAYPIRSVENKRCRINRWARQQVERHARHLYLEMDIDSSTAGFFRPDGVHLSDVGLEFYLDYLRDAILTFVSC